MMKRMEKLRLRAPSIALVIWVGMTASAMSGRFGVVATARSLSPTTSTPATSECEGAACSQVTLTFDEQKQQYRVRNNSSDIYVRVSASNAGSSADACVAPGKTAYLPLKSIVGSYRADPSGSSCGSPEGT